MYEFKLPDVGEGIHEAEILKWLVREGDLVAQDQPLLEIQTDKAVVEIPSPVAGKIATIQVQAGALAQVGEPLVAIAPVDEPHHDVSDDDSARPDKSVLAAPAVRKLAQELGIELTDVPGSGPAGRVLPGDVRRFTSEQPAAMAGGQAESMRIAPSSTVQSRQAPGPSPTAAEEPLLGLRRRIAERIGQAWREIPHVTALDEVDASQLVALRQKLRPEAEAKGVRLTYLPLIIKAAVQTLKAFPYFNASLDMAQQKIIKHSDYHLGIATATPEGLLVPVLRHADRLTVVQLAAELERLTELARQRTLSPAELSGSTFSITNFGSVGVAQATPIINPPEVAILGCGRISDRPLAVAGELAIRPVLPLALSFDHRLIDGVAAAQFLDYLKKRLTQPELLLLELV